VHLLRSLAETDPTNTIISIDGVGAFDHVSRARIMTEIAGHDTLRCLVPFLKLWYEEASTFLRADANGAIHDIRQAEGGEQGDALMPALFSMALRPALAEIQARLPAGDLVTAYLDDIYIVTRPERARHVYDIVQETLWRVCRIRINQGKLVCWNRSGGAAPDGISTLDTPGHTVWRGDAPPELNGIKVLGAPIGSNAFVQAHATRTLEQQGQLLEAIAEMELTQDAWLLFYFCAVPRANYLLRTVPPNQVAAYAGERDQQILDTFKRLFQVPGQYEGDAPVGSGPVWERQAQLPLRFGGCGLRNASRTSTAAYWASLADCLHPLRLRYPEIAQGILACLESQAEGRPASLVAAGMAAEALDTAGMHNRPTWRGLYDGARPAQPSEDERDVGEWAHGWQYHASKALEQTEYNSVLGALRGRTAIGPLPGPARLRSCAGPFASVWLTAAPTSDALQLSNDEMMCTMRRRLGLPIEGLAERCEGCRAPLDPYGHHRLACTRTGRLHARHRGLVAAWRQVFAEAGGQVPRRNVERLLSNTHVPTPPGDQRRLDLVVPGLGIERGLPLFCDVTCVTPVSANGTARSGCLTIDGGALRGAQRTNDATYPEVERSGLGRLCCLSVETYGRWGADCLRTVKAMAKERTRGLPRRVRRGTELKLLHRWWSILGMATQRMVVQAIARTSGADLVREGLEHPPGIGDLPSLAW